MKKLASLLIEEILPAVGQGIIAVQCRKGDKIEKFNKKN